MNKHVLTVVVTENMTEARMRESDVTNAQVRQKTVGDDIRNMEPELYKLLVSFMRGQNNSREICIVNKKCVTAPRFFMWFLLRYIMLGPGEDMPRALRACSEDIAWASAVG